MSRLVARPVSLSEANAFVAALHRHHPPATGHKFSIGAAMAGRLVGVVIVGRPVSRHRDDGATLEVTRLCTDGTRNACSFLYGRAAKAAFALGYTRIGTYTLPDEGGASLRASGWHLIGERGGGEWSAPSRPRRPMQSPIGQKWLWELSACALAALLLAAPATAETDACRHYQDWPVEIVSEWVGDLVCGDIAFEPKGVQPLDPNPRLTALVARYGSGEAVRAMVQADDRPINVIPLPGAFWLLASALAGLWAWGRRG